MPDALLRSNPSFSCFCAARVASALAIQVESIALGWQVYTTARLDRDVPHSALLVGVLGLVQFVPLMLLTLPAGSLADRRDRRSIMAWCLALELMCALGLGVVAMRPPGGLMPVFALAAVVGTARAFQGPAASALGPTLVPSAELFRAVAWTTLGDQLGSVLGPWLGGLLCAWSTPAAYGAAAALHATTLVMLIGVRPPPMPAPAPGSQLAHIAEGLRYIWRQPVILGATTLDLAAVLIGGVTALLPIFATDVLHAGAIGFGLLRSGAAIGATVAAIALSRWPIRRQAGRWIFSGVALFGATTLVFAVSRSLSVSILALGLMGAADMVSVYVRQALVQIVTPDAYRGRVGAVTGLFIGASADLGDVETGLAARLLGPVAAAVVGGIGSLVVTAAWALGFPALRRADRIDGEER